ncbi:AAA family ATPase [Lentibacillus salicampi]|nr:AAA family ATPase [Lentibacillus salicampi]
MYETYYQANPDGSIEYGIQPHGLKKSETISKLKEALTYNGWTITSEKTNSKPFNFIINAHEKEIELYVYIWKISNGGREREHEQRIQIATDVNQDGFNVDNNNPNKKGLLLGEYNREGCPTVYAAWETETNRNHGKSKSCFINTKAIAKAMRDGFVQTIDSSGNIACAFQKEFMNFYINNLVSLHSLKVNLVEGLDSGNDLQTEVDKVPNVRDVPYEERGVNKIVYGAPGVGKSYSLGTSHERITFHPEFTYFDFIGGIKPGKVNGELTYEFKEGPFLKILKDAYLFDYKQFTLVIEEINRANTAAVFGDIFQLLDRNEYGESTYSIENEDILNYLNKDTKLNLNKVKIPANFNIYATMNNADQGVFVMDSAFKRRWEFEYKPISFEGVSHADEVLNYAGYQVTWQNFATCINDFLSSKIGINEDKLIGPYFLKKTDLKNNRKIAFKLLIYLWDDVVRHERYALFANQFNTFGEVSNAFIKGNQSIFNKDLEGILFENRLLKETEEDGSNE